MSFPVVTLTTDWGDRNHYVAMVKGRLHSSLPGVSVVDLSHSQDWDSMAVASKIIQFGCFSFPEGTVHIVDICEDLSVRNSLGGAYKPVPLLAVCKGHFFLCCNRKLLEYSLDTECESVVALPLQDGIESNTFLAYSLFCDVAVRLLCGAKPSELGVEAKPLARRGFLRAQFDGTVISARPDCVDHYGNVTLNLKYSDFETYRAGRAFRFEIEYQVGSIEKYPSITRLSKYYDEVAQGQLLLTVSSTGYLQLAISHGSVVQYLGINYSTVCRIIFIG